MVLRARFVGNRLGGDELGEKAAGVGIEQLLKTFVALRLQNEADMMILRDPVGDFRIAVGGSIGMFLASERKNDSGIIASRGR